MLVRGRCRRLEYLCEEAEVRKCLTLTAVVGKTQHKCAVMYMVTPIELCMLLDSQPFSAVG